jgi:prolyl 4-hydroxylase
MPCTSLADHVLIFPGALAPDRCQTLIHRFESSADLETCQLEAGFSFSQLNVTERWPDENKILLPIFLSHFNKYQLALNARFWPPKFCFENLRMKRYLPNGRDLFPLHVDVMGQTASRRFMTAFIYLNAPEGGETVFPHLAISVQPEPGKLLAFPPLWLFPHAGLAPKSSPKYILHTYLCYPA